MEYKDADQKRQFDRELEADPAERRMDPGLMAVMAAARMPQQSSAFAAAGSEWRPGAKR